MNITEAQEQHNHTYDKETFGSDIGKAALAGAITGAVSGFGGNMSKIANEYVSATVGDISGIIVGKVSGTVTSTSIITLSNTTGNAMSSVVLNGGSFSDVLKAGSKSLTSKDTWENILTSGITSTLTIGLTQYIDNKFNNIISNGNLNNNPFATTGQQFTSALAESTISNITSTAVQSAFNGEDFEESLKNQLLTSLVMAGAKIGANEIGSLAHETEVIDNNGNTIGYIPAEINRIEQLLLHAGLGAITAKLTNNDMLSGAVAGVMGEVVGEYAGNKLYDKDYNFTEEQKNTLKEIGSFAGGIGAMFTGLAQGQDGKELTDNIYGGQRIGKNAVENNYVLHAARDLDAFWKQSGRHSFIVSIPDNPEDFTPEKLIENGLDPNKFKFINIGNGEKGIISSAFDVNGKLKAEINNKTDLKALKDYYLNNGSSSYGTNSILWDFDVETFIIKPMEDISDTNFIYNILQNTQNYMDNTKINSIPYSVNPAYCKGYNCNSYSNGLLQNSGSNQTRPTDFKGMDWGKYNTIPSKYFNNIEGRK